jgi:hypothetical protein
VIKLNVVSSPEVPIIRTDRRFEAVVFVIAALVAAFAACVLFRRPVPPLPMDDLATRAPIFETRRAMEDARALATACPSRVTGSSGALCAARLVKERFRALGLATRVQTFPMWLRGKRVTGRNVFAVSHGTTGRSMIVMAHYDASPTSRESATDNASGVATLLELARIFSAESHPRSILFVASDAGEWGMIGADRFAASRAWEAVLGPGASTPYAALSLDHVKSGIAHGIDVHGAGQFGGFTPLWLRVKVALAIHSAGVEVFPETFPKQVLERALGVPFQDHGPLIRHGIAALNLSTHVANDAQERRVYHTDEDQTDRLLPGAMMMFGTAAETAVNAVNHAAVISSPDIVTVSPRKILLASVLRAIAGVLFLPLLAIAAASARGSRGTPRAAVKTLAWALPPVAGVLALRGTVAVALLPRFELYPATLKDPFLTTWQPLPMLLALAATALAAALAARVAHVSPASRRAGALWALSVASIWAWGRDDLAAALFLAPAAWCWPLIGLVEGRLGRLFDALLLAAGAAPFLVALVLFGHMMFLGPWIVWYAALQAAYGVWSLQAVAILGAAAGAGFTLLSAPLLAEGAGGSIRKSKIAHAS